MPELPTVDQKNDNYALRGLPENGLGEDSDRLPFGPSSDGVTPESTTAPVDFTVEPAGARGLCSGSNRVPRSA